jgi:hypothetical protein
MNQLYPIIRRVRRPLFPPEDEKKAVAPIAEETAQIVPASSTASAADVAATATEASEPVEASLLALAEAPAVEPKKAKGKSRANPNS